MAVYKIPSSHFQKVDQADFIGDENRLFYTVGDGFVSFYLSDGQTPGGTPVSIGGGGGNGETQFLTLSGTTLGITGGNAVDLASTGFATEDYVDAAVADLATRTYVDTAIADLATETEAFIAAAVNGLATEAYVDTAVAGLSTQTDIDTAVAGLATEDYVNTAVSGLASTGYVDATVSSAVNGLATEDYVDTAVTGLATEAFVTAAVNGIVAGAGSALDTLNELAAAIGDDPDFAVNIANALADKVGYADFETQFDINMATSTTDELAEGVNNLYYTDARVHATMDADVANAITTANAYTDGLIATEHQHHIDGDADTLASANTYTDTREVAITSAYQTYVTSQGYLTSYTETDPIFNSSAASSIVVQDIINWSNAYSWGNHAIQGYLKTETDPIFNASPASGITAGNITNWNTAFSWGDHNTQGYLTSYTETDPVFTASPASGITIGMIGDWTTSYSWGDHSIVGYLTSETTTSLDIAGNVLTYTDETGAITNIDLSLYLDDTNLARLVSGSIDGVTGIATFTRDDASTFTVDFSPLFDDTNLARVTSGAFNNTTGDLTLTRDDATTAATINLDGRYLTTETDPVFAASPASGITGPNIINWNTAFSWGNHATAGYLTSYTETDPIFTASPAASIAGVDIINWNTAFSWGDHSTQGYLTSYTETDPIFTASPAGGISATDITNWNTAFGWGDHSTQGYLTSYTETDPIFTASEAFNITATDTTNWDTAFSWGDHSVVGYLTSYTETDPIFTASEAFNITATDTTNWNTAFSWGDHSVVGYLTSETTTSLDIAGNVLTYTDETGATTDIDLSLYLDDTNLARLVSGTIDGATGIATFTRDDATSFTVDFSPLFDDTNLARVTSGAFNNTNGDLTLTRDDATTAATINLDGRYLTSYTETDPVFTASPAGGITATQVTNWNTAFGWGNHADVGYLTSYTETDPVFTAWDRSTGITITESQITDLTHYTDADVATYLTTNNYATQTDITNAVSNTSINDLTDVDTTGAVDGSVLKYNTTSGIWEVSVDETGAGGTITLTDLSVTQNAPSGTGTLTYNNTNGVFTYTPPELIATETDPVFTASPAGTITTTDINNWNTAYQANDDATFNTITATSGLFTSIQLDGGLGTQGTITWNPEDETLDLINDGAVLQIGQETHIHVRNNTGVTIPNGTVVYATGALGASGRITVAPMIADGTVPARAILGVTTEDIEIDTDGMVTSFGKVRSVNTSAFNDGEILYVSPIVPGSLTDVEPAYPNISLPIAIVVNANNNGTIFVRVTPVDENEHAGYAQGLLADSAVQPGDNVSELVNDAGYLTSETTTSLAIAGNILTYTDETGATTDIDLSLYLDDTNLARLVSGTLDGGTGIATFTRDDATSFTVDFSPLFDDTNLARVTSGAFNNTTGDLTLTRDDATTAATINLDGRYLTSYTETDPVFTASPAGTITNADIINWTNAFNWGDHAAEGYLTSFTETDPIFTASEAFNITATDTSNWDTAFGWGDHSTVGYLTSFTETDPIFTASEAFNITATDTANWNTSFSWGNHADAGYLTSFTETDPVFTASPAGTITSQNIVDWNTSFSWGDHSTVGYLTSETNTSLAIAGNILTYTDETGATTDIDLSIYLDDTNLARLVSGSIDAGTGIATFTRDDASTFTVDFSPLFDNTNLSRINAASFNIGTGELTLTRDDATTAATIDLDGRYLTSYTETDPVFTASPAGTITSQNIIDWGTAFSWGDHATAGYLTSFTETDPVFTASEAFNITATDTTNWDTAFGWGNHADAGYITSFTETDPVFTASPAGTITSQNIVDWSTAFSWGDHATAGYLTSFTETDPIFTASEAFNITVTDTTNWDTAFGWGDHAAAGYLTTVALNDITDVDTTGVVDGNVLVYNATSGNFEVGTISGSGATALPELSDVNSAIAPTAGQVLTYNDTTSEWDAADPTSSPNVQVGWEDLIAPISSAKPPSSDAPVERPFGPTGLREEYSFEINEYIYVSSIHVKHDIDPGAEAYVHVHWSTDGTDQNPVTWEITGYRALGHNQANFTEITPIILTQIPDGGAWRHYVTETTVPLILTEPDELLMFTIRRISNGTGTENLDSVFGLQLDLHYQVTRVNTPNKSPDFFN